jgi:hypothetical protein
MYNTGDDAMIKVIGVLMILLLPASTFGAELMRLKHVSSVYADAAGGAITQPDGVECSGMSGFIVADSGNARLIPYLFQEGTVNAGNDIKMPQLSYPLTVKRNSKGDIFTLDGKTRRILRIDPNGALKGFVEPADLPDSEAVVTRNFTIDGDDNILVLDIFSERVLVLNPEGKYLRQLRFPKGFGFISDVAVDRKGVIFILDSVQAEVFSAAKDAPGFTSFTGSLKEYMDFPSAITFDFEGKAIITDRNGGGIVIIGPNGSFQGRLLSAGRSEGYLSYPSGACVNAKGEVFVADRNNNRIQIFTIVR